MAGEQGTYSSVVDADGSPNLQVVADNESVTITNPGRTEGGAVETQINISEQQTDGFFENGARRFTEFFSGAEEQSTVNLAGAGAVQTEVDAEGAATVTVHDGETARTVLTTQGDYDDSLLERVGERVDQAVEVVGNTASRVWRRFTGWFR